MKKTLSILLSLLMIISTVSALPFSVNADVSRYVLCVYCEEHGATENKTLNVDGTSISTVSDINKKTLKVSWKKVGKANDYEIEYRKAGAKKWTSAKTNNKTTYTIKKLAKGKTYYVRIRSVRTVNKQNYVGEWSAKKSVKIK